MAQSLFDDETRRQTTEAIQAIESVTSAEVVATVHHNSDTYRDASFLAGSILAFVALTAIIFLPQTFEVATIPLDVALAFAFGYFVCSRSAPLRRLLTSTKRKRMATLKAAKACFHDLGVSGTTGRTGILVYVSTLERRVEVISDIGVPVSDIGQPWRDEERALNAAVASGTMNAEGFLKALRAFGPLLADPLPRQDDDVNELSDEVRTAP